MSRESISGSQKQPASSKEDWPLLDKGSKAKADSFDKKSRISSAGGWSHLLPAIVYGEMESSDVVLPL
jgi:hypothetical protein